MDEYTVTIFNRVIAAIFSLPQVTPI